jgi:hypothetical protein
MSKLSQVWPCKSIIKHAYDLLLLWDYTFHRWGELVLITVFSGRNCKAFKMGSIQVFDGHKMLTRCFGVPFCLQKATTVMKASQSVLAPPPPHPFVAISYAVQRAIFIETASSL